MNTPRRGAIDGVLEAALYAENLDAAEAFYAGFLGLEVRLRAGNRHVFFNAGGTVLLVFNPAETVTPPPQGALPVPPHGAQGPGHVCFAMSADEIEALKARALAADIPVDADFTWPNGARSLYLRDPAGNSVEFAERRLWF